MFFFFLLLHPYLSIHLFIVSYRIFSSLFTCRSSFDCIFLSVSLSFRTGSFPPSLSFIAILFVFVFFSVGPYLSIHLFIGLHRIYSSLFTYCSCSCFVLLRPTVLVLSTLTGTVTPSLDRGLIYNGCKRTSLARRSYYHRIRHPFINWYWFINSTYYCYRSLYSDGWSDLRSSKSYVPILLNQIIPSKDNELRLTKAVRSSQHRNKEVGTRNRRGMQCTRQEHVSSSTVVPLSIAMIKIVISSVCTYKK